MNESPSPVSPVVDPVALIERIVFPDLLSPAVPHAITKLSDVPDSVAHVGGPLGDKVLSFFLIKLEWSEFGGDFFGFVVVEVFGLEVVVDGSVENKSIFGLGLHISTGFALTHWYCYSNKK